MKKNRQDQAEREFLATVLDHKHQPLAHAKVLVMPSREEGSIYPFGDVAVSHLCNSAKFLWAKTEAAPVAIFELRACPTGGQSHLHFSYIKGHKTYEH